MVNTITYNFEQQIKTLLTDREIMHPANVDSTNINNPFFISVKSLNHLNIKILDPNIACN